MRNDVRFLWPYLARYRRLFALGFGALALKSGIGAAVPLAMRAGIDAMVAGRALRLVFGFAALMFGLALVKGLFQYWMRVILIGISRDIEYDLRNDLFARLVTLDAGFYGRTRAGDILARATNDMNAVRMMLGPGVMYWFETSLTLVFAVAVMLRTDWPLTLAALAPAPLVSLAVLKFGSNIHDRFEKIQAAFSDISSRVQETLAGVRVVRSYRKERWELESFERLNRDYIRENRGWRGSRRCSIRFWVSWSDALMWRCWRWAAGGWRRTRFRWADSSCLTPTWACWCGP